MDKCKYCLDYHESEHKCLNGYVKNESENTNHPPFEWGVEVGIFRDSAVRGKMYIDLLMNSENVTLSYFDIKYCPMCGRRLRE